uniref:Aminotransferase class III n=1 Tax=Anopheles coluzzii TaxID=1518534 RepID=A0A8W7PX15_ANOCL
MAVAYHCVRGDAARVKLIGRERGYHGVNFGGISVGGIAGNRKLFPVALPTVDHLRSTHDLARNAFTRGEPEFGAEFADELEARITTLHDPSTIAAVIVEPMAGSTGVLIPPKGYLKRLRQICDKYGILLIFDEVITGFGRLGADWAANKFDVLPDIITCAKGLSNGVVPMGALLVKPEIHDAFMAAAADRAIEFPAWLYLFGTPAGLRSLPLPRWTFPGRDAGKPVCWCAFTGDIIAVSPPLIISEAEIDRLFAVIGDAIQATA